MSHENGKVIIKYSKKGYIKVKGDFLLFDDLGNPLKTGKMHIKLCGCGLSKEMPICDGAHKKQKKKQKKLL